MELPKFLMADCSALQDDMFVLHTDYPRFLMNMATDEIEWFDEVTTENKNELTEEMVSLVDEAVDFFDQEIKKYEDE